MEEKDRFKKSQEAEKKRYRFEMKYSKQLEEARLRAGSQAAVKELDQVAIASASVAMSTGLAEPGTPSLLSCATAAARWPCLRGELGGLCH